jgi:membrane protease YdiL (CAAX protease family)
VAGDRREVSTESGYLPETRWTLTDVLFAIGAGIVASVLAAILIDPLGTTDLSVIEITLVLGAQAAASLLVLWRLSARRGTGNWSADYGLIVRPRDLWGVAAGGGLQLAVALVMAIPISLLFPEGPPQQGLGETSQAAETALETVLLLILLVIVAPLVEEIIFRGVMLSRLCRDGAQPLTQMWLWLAGSVLVMLSIALGRSLIEGVVVATIWTIIAWGLYAIGRERPVVWAVGNTAAMFAVIHLLDPNTIALMPGLFIIGIVLGIAAIRRGNLSLAIPLHAGVNLVGALVLFFGEDLIDWLERVSEEMEQIEGVVRLLL